MKRLLATMTIVAGALFLGTPPGYAGCTTACPAPPAAPPAPAASVPEPASLALFGVGLIGLGFVVAKRRS
jgi:hypothetical protein